MCIRDRIPTKTWPRFLWNMSVVASYHKSNLTIHYLSFQEFCAKNVFDGFLRINPRMIRYHPINTPPTMLQYTQFSNPVSDTASSVGAHLDSHDTCSQYKRCFWPTISSTIGIIWNAIRFAAANTIANSISYQVKLGQDSLGIWALSRPTTNRIQLMIIYLFRNFA